MLLYIAVHAFSMVSCTKFLKSSASAFACVGMVCIMATDGRARTKKGHTVIAIVMTMVSCSCETHHCIHPKPDNLPADPNIEGALIRIAILPVVV